MNLLQTITNLVTQLTAIPAAVTAAQTALSNFVAFLDATL